MYVPGRRAVTNCLALWMIVHYDYKFIPRRQATVTQCLSLETEYVGVADRNGVICEWLERWIKPAAASKAALASPRKREGCLS